MVVISWCLSLIRICVLLQTEVRCRYARSCTFGDVKVELPNLRPLVNHRQDGRGVRWRERDDTPVVPQP